jgi:hypothetical protein
MANDKTFPIPIMAKPVTQNVSQGELTSEKGAFSMAIVPN